MASVKNLAQKLADEGLTSYIVTYDYFDDDDDAAANGCLGTPDPEDVMMVQYWAESKQHAGEQYDADLGYARVLSVETQEDYERRTGETLDYGRRANV